MNFRAGVVDVWAYCGLRRWAEIIAFGNWLQGWTTYAGVVESDLLHRQWILCVTVR